MDTLDKIQQERDLYRQERDLYRRLLELGRQTALEPFLRDALALVVGIVGARQGYLELYSDDDPGRTPRWWIAHGLSPEAVDGVRGQISRGIIGAAIAGGRTVSTSSALLDPRFSDRPSVSAQRIEAVMCAPIGEDVPRGVVYLQGRQALGMFSEEDRERTEIFARHVAPLAGRLIAEQRHEAEDAQGLRGRLRLTGVIGGSPAFVAVLKQVALLAPLDVHVLLTGESGTGKSQLARVIHDNGPRASGPFVEVSCAALPEALFESELFGALPGAHSTATRRIEGKVAAAEGGTLFLDEIGELPPPLQAKLLQLLHAKHYYPLGSAKPLRADVRVIAATNMDLDQAVVERRFREDLLYRLQVMPVRVPTLAERRDDIHDLAVFFCDAAAARHHLGRLELSSGALRAAEVAEWPGNVRQLAHAVEAAAIRAAGEGVTIIEKAHLFSDLAASPSNGEQALTLQQATRRFQAGMLRRTLEETDWNVPEAARRLDVARSHFYKLIRVFGLSRDQR
jgi:Nif-specific regulatory protein